MALDSSDGETGGAGGVAWPTVPIDTPGSGASASDGGMLPGSSTSVPDGIGRLDAAVRTPYARAGKELLDAFVAEGVSAGSGLSLDARSLRRQRAGSDDRVLDAKDSDLAGAGSGVLPDARRAGPSAAGSVTSASSAAGGVPPAHVDDRKIELNFRR